MKRNFIQVSNTPSISNLISRIEIDCRVFVCINTTKYNEDGRCVVQVVHGMEGCKELGWGYDKEEELKIDTMEVGEVVIAEDYDGVYLLRIG